MADRKPQSSGRVMVTRNGIRKMLKPLSTERIDGAEGTAATRYRIAVELGARDFPHILMV